MAGRGTGGRAPQTRAEQRRAAAHERRAAARRRAARKGASFRRRRLVKRIGLGVLAAAVVGGTVGLVVRSRDGDGIDRTGSERLDGPAVTVTRTPTRYRVAYRVEEPRVGTSTVDLRIRRPFDGRRVQTTDGGAVDTQVVQQGLSLRGSSGAAAPQVLQTPPGPNQLDVRLGAILGSAPADRLQVREVRRVLGRRCQVVRTASRLGAVRLRPLEAGSWVDSCVDEAGLVLEEVTVSAGSMTRRSLATEVEEDPAFDDATFAIDPAAPRVPVDKGGGDVRPLAEGERPPGRSIEVAAPAGFTAAGRFVVVPPQPENFTDPNREGLQRAGTVDLFTRGPDVVSFEQGSTLRGGDPFDGDKDGTPVEVPNLGPGRLVVAGAGLELLVSRGGGRYVRILGTVDQATLLGVAAGARTG